MVGVASVSIVSSPARPVRNDPSGVAKLHHGKRRAAEWPLYRCLGAPGRKVARGIKAHFRRAHPGALPAQGRTETIILRSSFGSLMGDLLWLATIAFVFAIITGVVH